MFQVTVQAVIFGSVMFKHPRPILIVDDDVELVTLLVDYLQLEGFAPVAAHNGTEALELLSRQEFEIVVLDVMMPGMSGVEVLKRIREKSQLPVLMLTAKGDPVDRIIGLELGADDYLVKPFSPRELVARVRALLRRVHADSEPQREVLEFGELTIDVSGHKVLVKGKEVDLTASEFKLLTTLSRYPGRVYSRMELVEKVLGYDFEGYERTIDSHVKNLRAKIGDNPRNPKWLHTVHGVGYRFEDPTKQ